MRIKGPSGHEEAVREEVKRLMTEAGAVPIRQTTTNDPTAPRNLVMEIPASTALADKRGILLNAHIDTISRSTPELLAFDPDNRDFYHPDEANPNKVSSFGGMLSSAGPRSKNTG